MPRRSLSCLGLVACLTLWATGAAGADRQRAEPRALPVGATRTPAQSARARPRRQRHHARPVDGLPSGEGNRLIWSDEFNGPSGAAPNPNKWSFDTGGDGWGNEELEYYTARRSNAALDGHGDLVITARAERYVGRDGVSRGFTSAKLETKGLFSTTYGRIEARMQLPAGQGLWPAFWALGSDIEHAGWPGSGEIDVMEELGNEPFTLYGSIHGPTVGTGQPYGLTAGLRSYVSLASGFHVYGVQWSPNRIVFTFDGYPYASRTPSSLAAGQRWVFDKPFFLLLNLAVGGTWPGSPDASTHFPARLTVDWVRVYD